VDKPEDKSAVVNRPEDEPAAVDEPEDEPVSVDRLDDKPATVDGPKDESMAGEDSSTMVSTVRMRRSSRWGPVAMLVLEMLGFFCTRKVSSVYLSLLGYKKTFNKPLPFPACLAC
jgi:hypothetical protein